MLTYTQIKDLDKGARLPLWDGQPETFAKPLRQPEKQEMPSFPRRRTTVRNKFLKKIYLKTA